MQKEVSERIIASEGNKIYGSLSIFVQTFSQVEILFNVSKNVFFPIPKVNSSFIKFKLLPNNRDIDIHKYSYFLKNIFSYRRKKIGNVLSKYILIEYSKLEIKKQLEENIGIDSEKRPEEIPVEKYIDIFKFYEKLIDFPLL
jgi:16S rRNA (adenine1518-N6/adenine1519-N6)-dimethyltransferase